MIDYFNCSITGVRLRSTVRLRCPITAVQPDRLVKNKAVDAPITFKEMVMNMIMLHVSWLFK